ncbi:hypothetical protein EDB84DRAFT_892683 [Lactarius hengduanensis]|nr:hypothetical protein EDB84DRAFT_892683 [Lactarius hengduanensis]
MPSLGRLAKCRFGIIACQKKFRWRRCPPLAIDVAASQDILVDIFGRIEGFFVWLEIYIEVRLTPAMTKKMEITVEVLDILATATKEMEQSRAKKIIQKVAGRTDQEDGPRKLDKLTNEEVAMASVQLVKVTHNIDNNVSGIDDGVRGVDVRVQVVNDNFKAVGDSVKTIAEGEQSLISDTPASSPILSSRRQDNHGSEINPPTNWGRRGHCEAFVISPVFADGRVSNTVTGNQLRDSLRKWQSPPDPSTNHNIAGDRQHEGTAEWFSESNQFESLKVTGSLLWIHGKPGSGKSVICSPNINDLTTLCEAGFGSMAYLTFKDVDKQARRNLLQSLLIQHFTRSNAFCDILSRLYKTHDNGARQPSDKALDQCLREMLALPNQGPVYLIIDSLDECPGTSNVPSAREQVLDLVNDLLISISVLRVARRPTSAMHSSHSRLRQFLFRTKAGRRRTSPLTSDLWSTLGWVNS